MCPRIILSETRIARGIHCILRIFQSNMNALRYCQRVANKPQEVARNFICPMRFADHYRIEIPQH